MRYYLCYLLVGWLALAERAEAFFTIIDPDRWPAGSRQVILTFDDGPNAGVSGALMDVLARHGVIATFFYTGRNVEKHPQLVQRAHREGHVLALHGYAETWPNFWNARALQRSLAQSRELLREATGERELEPRLYRPPRGVITPAVFWLGRRCQYDLGFITFYGRDSAATPGDVAQVLSRTTAGLLEHQGGAILFHSSRFKSDPAIDNLVDKSWLPEAVDRFIAWAKEQGFSFVSYNADPHPKCP